MRPVGGFFRRIAAGLASAALFACLGGSGTETESSLAVHLENADGSPAVAARIVIRTSDYVKDSTAYGGENLQPTLGFTNAHGDYHVDGLPLGSYRLEGAGMNGTGFVHDFAIFNEKTEAKLGTVTLRPTGKITGRLFADSAPLPNGYVQVYGMERLVRVDPASGEFTVSDLPAGSYNLRCVSFSPIPREARIQGVQVAEGEVKRVDSVILAATPKFTFSITGGALEIAGLNSETSVIFDNEQWGNGVDDEFVWAKASSTQLRLRANIVTDAMNRDRITWQDQLNICRGEIKLAHLAGLVNIPDPIVGATAKLVPREPLLPERSVGSDFIVSLAHEPGVSPSNPILIVAGGPPTTIANAYLTDSTIAANIVVAGVFNFTINADDTLATYLVTKKFRCIQWGRNYVWGGNPSLSDLSQLPGSWMGRRMAAHMRASIQKSPDKVPLGDMAPVAYLLRHSLWNSANRARIAPPLQVSAASPLAYDFLDIPQEANDWQGFLEEFYTTMKNDLAYYPLDIPGEIEAEAFSNTSGTALVATDPGAMPDTVYGFDAVGGFSTQTWCEYTVFPQGSGNYTATIHYRSPQGAKLRFGPPGAPLATVALPASAIWTETSAQFAAPEGKAVWRVTASEGVFDLDKIEVK